MHTLGLQGMSEDAGDAIFSTSSMIGMVLWWFCITVLCLLSQWSLWITDFDKNIIFSSFTAGIEMLPEYWVGSMHTKFFFSVALHCSLRAFRVSPLVIYILIIITAYCYCSYNTLNFCKTDICSLVQYLWWIGSACPDNLRVNFMKKMSCSATLYLNVCCIMCFAALALKIFSSIKEGCIAYIPP